METYFVQDNPDREPSSVQADSFEEAIEKLYNGYKYIEAPKDYIDKEIYDVKVKRKNETKYYVFRFG